MKTSKSISFEGSVFFSEVKLVDAKIENNLVMNGTKFIAELNMNGIRVGGSLFMWSDRKNRAEFKEVILLGARIDGELNIQGSKFNGKLNVNSIRVGSNLNIDTEIDKRTEFMEDVDLLGAKIDGQLNMIGPKFKGTLRMQGIQIRKQLKMVVFIDKEIDLSYAKIEGAGMAINLDLLPTLDLTRAEIHGVFSLERYSKPENWEKGAKLILRNAEVGAIQDLPDVCWPDDLKLEGFTYSRLGGFKFRNVKSGQEVDEITKNIADRPIKWFKEWLEKDKSYSPQPYEQLATVLRNSGNKDKANEVLFAGKQREFIETEWLSLSKLWLFLQLIFVGYGYKISFAFYWAIILTFIGAAVFQSTPQSDIYNMPYGISFSFDTLLPIIELEEIHDTIKFTSWQKYYFYFHKAMGYILASFLIAGLSGITKK